MEPTPERYHSTSEQQEQQKERSLQVGDRVEFYIGSRIKDGKRVPGSGVRLEGTVIKILPTIVYVKGDDGVVRKMARGDLKIID